MIFDRKKYKNFARKQLQNRWLVPVLMTLTTMLVMMIFQIPYLVTVYTTDAGATLLAGNYSDYKEFIELFDQATSTQPSNLFSLIQLIVAAILEMSAINVYLKMSRSPQKVSFRLFIESLNNWWKAIKAFLWQFIWVVLWSCLFFIPGIIKAISYSQMYYLLNEYENLSINKAMKISMIITKGHKVDLLMTFLSFLGWYCLVLFTFGIGMIWLKPYMHLTFVNSYHAILKDALETGLIRPEDLQ